MDSEENIKKEIERRILVAAPYVELTEESQHSAISSMQVMLGFILAGLAFLHPSSEEEIRWFIFVGIASAFIGMSFSAAYYIARTEQFRKITNDIYDAKNPESVEEVNKDLNRADSIHQLFNRMKWATGVSMGCFVVAILIPMLCNS